MHPDCFKPYNDLCNLIEYISRDFELHNLGIGNHSGIFMYISLSSDP